MKKDYISWDEYFMGIAELSAKRSKDPNTQVGACIVDKDTKKILSIGYNGLPYGTPDSNEIWDSDEKHNYVVHAEANAILNTTDDLTGSILYVTMFPCKECAKLLAQKRIGSVVYKDDKFLKKEGAQAALNIFKNAGIKVLHYGGDDDSIN